MVRLLKQVRRGGSAGMLADLNLRAHDAATVIEGFGRKMCVTFLHGILAQRGRARLVPVEGQSLPDGRCRVIIHPPLNISPAATYQQIAQQCWDFFVPTINAQPEHWLWTYRHWRYLPAAATCEYPFYACPCPEFEVLLAGNPAAEPPPTTVVTKPAA